MKERVSGNEFFAYYEGEGDKEETGRHECNQSSPMSWLPNKLIILKIALD